MKKTYVYFLVPLIGLIVFIAFYWNFSKGYEAREHDKIRIEREKKQAKLREEAANREQAIKDAIAAQEKRKQDRAIKEEKDKKDREAREASIEAARKAHADRERFARNVDRLKGEIKNETEAVAKIIEEQKKLVDEEAFLRVFVKQAQGNVDALAKVLDKIEMADKARAEAERAAKAAAKNS